MHRKTAKECYFKFSRVKLQLCYDNIYLAPTAAFIKKTAVKMLLAFCPLSSVMSTSYTFIKILKVILLCKNEIRDIVKAAVRKLSFRGDAFIQRTWKLR